MNALTQALVAIVLIGLIVMIYGVRLNVNYIDTARGFLMATAMGFGVGVVNCYLTSMFHIWKFIWSVANRPLFIISGVFFLIDPLPEHIRSMLLWNPLVHPIMMLRRGIYESYDAVYVSEFYVYSCALVLSVLGMLLLHRYHRIILDEGA